MKERGVGLLPSFKYNGSGDSVLEEEEDLNDKEHLKKEIIKNSFKMRSIVEKY